MTSSRQRPFRRLLCAPRNARPCQWTSIFLLILASHSLWAGKEFTAKPGQEVAPNRLLVKLKQGAPAAPVIAGFLRNANIVPLALPDHYLVQVPGGIPPGISTLLAAHALVDYVEPDSVRRLILSAPNDPNYINSTSGQWGLFTVQALQAWNAIGTPYLTAATAGTGRVKVAVLDTGADCTHPDFMNAGGSSTDSALGGQLLWSSSQAFVATTVASPACAWQDDHGHGTHVAGIVGAATANGSGVASLGYPLQVVAYKVLNASGSGSDSVIHDAIVAAVNAGARVVSMSLGGTGYSQTLQDAVDYAWKNNVVVVAAAGNNSSSDLFFPGDANHAIGVSATDINNNLASFSNFGNGVSLAAPGVSILSTIPRYSVALGCCNYGLLSGTSMATPFVSALAGLVAMTTPTAPAAAIVQRMEQTAATSTAGGVWGSSYGYGIINAYNSVSGANRATSSGGIAGQIVDTTATPVGGAQITVAGQTVTTDATGLFWIRPVAAGTYPATVAAAGFPTQSLGVTVVSGADSHFDVMMGVGYGNFTGSVTDQGVAISGATVQAFLSGSAVATTATDVTGHYTLWVPGGSGYTLQASQIGSSAGSVSALSVGTGSSTAVNLTIASMFSTVAGVVQDANPAAISGAQITVSSSTFTANGVTNAAGSYSIGGVPAGTYSVSASATGKVTATQNGVTAPADGTATVNFQLATAPGAAPMFNPAGGSFAIPQSVTITSSTPGASIRYTMDGSTPSATAGTLYTGPVLVGNGSTTLKAVAYTSTIPASPVASATYNVSSSVWYGTGGTWSNRRRLTINHTQVAGTAGLSNFPVLVSLTDASLAAVAKADGSDILFTAGDGLTKLNHEIELYSSATGQLAAWVNVPALAAGSDTVLYLYYGNPSAASQQNAAGVWDSDYKAVYHLPNGVVLTGNDSTGNANQATALNGTTAQAGSVGGGASFNGTSNFIALGNAHFGFPAGSSVTFSAWAKRNSLTQFGNTQTIASRSPNVFSTSALGQTAAGNPRFAVYTSDFAIHAVSGPVAAAGSWNYVVGRFDSSSKELSIWVNGAKAAASTLTGLTLVAMNAGSGNALIGADGNGANAYTGYFGGALDELRFSGVARSDAWIATEYNNQNAPGLFVTVGPIESPGGGSTVTVTVASTPVGLSLTVDGAVCTSPCAFQWTAGSAHTIAVATQGGTSGTRYVFASWSDGGGAAHTITPGSATTYTATFTTQYFLTTAASPTAGGTIAPVSGWYDAGSVVPVSATANPGYQFTGFSGALTGTATPQNATLNAPASVTANFSATVAMTVASAPAGLSLTVDSAACTSPCAFQWIPGSTHTIAAATQAGTSGTQYVFASWSDSGAASHTITAPGSAATYTATFTTQYFLTTAVSPTAGGTIAPVSGWYNAGSVVSVSAAANVGYQFSGFSGALTGTSTPQNVSLNAPAGVTANFALLPVAVTMSSAPAGLSLTVDSAACTSPCAFQWIPGSSHTIAAATQAGTSGTQYVFASWSDSGAASHTITAPGAATTYTATFTTQYFLTTAASPTAGGTIAPASGWYNAGSVVAVSAAANGGYQFSGFLGALTGTSTPQNVSLNAPASVTANFSGSALTLWYGTGGTWSNRKRLTINHTQVAGTSGLSNFPVLVSLTDASLAPLAKPDGSDILFTAGDGVTKLNHEIELYSSATGQLAAWVNVPALAAGTDTVLYLYYGNPSAASQQNAAGVWDSDYKAVYHLPNGAVLTGSDSTVNANQATALNGTTAQAGWVGGGASFNGTSNFIALGNAHFGFPAGSSVTFSAWAKRNSLTQFGNTQTIASRSPNVFSTNALGQTAAGNPRFAVYTSDFAIHAVSGPVAVAAGSWNYVVGRFDSSSKELSIWVNGAKAAASTLTGLTLVAMNAGSGNALIGADGNGANAYTGYFGGALDELRFSGVARSDAWIATEYNNQSAPASFVTSGPQEALTVTVMVASTPVGLSLTVDGTACTSPCTFQSIYGSSHTIAAATQAGTSGTQYVFANWSDGAAPGHTIKTPGISTTYSANFATQYFLTTAASTGGTISPVSGWYDAGSVVPVSTTPAAQYQFTGFSGALTGTATPQSVTMNAPASVLANFGTGMSIAGCTMLPTNNVWNTPVDQLPLDANSAAYVSTIGAAKPLHPDFTSTGAGIPFLVVPGTQPKVPLAFTFPGESDPGPYPIPANVPIEGGPNSTGDRHVLVVDNTACTLYETYSSYPQTDGSWNVYSGAVFPLNSNQLRPPTWTSADAAGLPILPGLVRYEEVAAGQINHAIRMTAPQTRNQFIWPARHKASSLTGTQYPPMGQRFRLKAGFDITTFPGDVQVILTALKKYGMILADNGSSWFVTGAPDPRWNDDSIHQLTQVLGSNFEAVDESSLMVDPNSGAVAGGSTTVANRR